MNVELIQATPEPVKLITDIASICYGRDEAKYPDRLFRHLYEGGHHSTFEHVYYTFKIKGISRACLAQLTRHRHASYTVRSQRYTSESEGAFIVPPAIVEKDNIFQLAEMHIERAKVIYDTMIQSGIRKEDARFMLPEGTATDLYMSFNLREFMHIYKLRSSPHAQWEIKKLVEKMKKEIVRAGSELELLFKEGE